MNVSFNFFCSDDSESFLSWARIDCRKHALFGKILRPFRQEFDIESASVSGEDNHDSVDRDSNVGQHLLIIDSAGRSINRPEINFDHMEMAAKLTIWDFPNQ
jgi:hypothetical protein